MRDIKHRGPLCLTLLLLVLARTAAAQDVSIHEAGGADPILRGPIAGAAGTSLDRGAVGGGDNRGDLIVGSPGTNNVGRVSIFFGASDNGTGLIDLTPANADATLEGTVAGSRFGTSTASGFIFNVQADGVERDVVVGAPGSNTSAGFVYVFDGPIVRGTRSASTAGFTITGGIGERFGTTVATADLNNDGYREVIVGALGAPGAFRSGRVYVFNLRGRTPGTIAATSADMTLVENDELLNSGLGEVIESGGDITGDGIFDLAIGLPRAYGTGAVVIVAGRAGWVFPGAQLVLTPATALFRGADPGDRAGASLTFRNIVSSDTVGVLDLVIGAPGADGAGNARGESGEVYVLWGGSICTPSCVRTPANAGVVFYGAEANMRTGERVTGGDINRDAPDDLVLLAPASGLAQLQVIYGTRTRAGYGPLVSGVVTIDLATAGAIDRRVKGTSLTTLVVYEVTGEGANDIVTAAPTADSGRGLVYVTISPKFAMSSRSFTVTLAECATGAKLFTVENPSIIPLPWSVRTSANAPWMKVVPPGSSSLRGQPGLMRIILTPAGLTPGLYSANVEIVSTSPHLEMFIRVTINMTVQAATPFAPNANTDFNGDGCGDTPVFRPTSGLWRMPGRADVALGTFGDLPVPGDYNGDLVAEPAVYRPSNGTWYFEGSNVRYGEPGDIPVPGDYDGNGVTDIAVYRPSIGQWLIRTGSGGLTINFGAMGELPVPGDYDGDGDTDAAVYMPGSGVWRIRNLSTVQWGLGFDVPVPADYDGDGDTDVAVYRRTNGVWYIKDQVFHQWGNARTFPLAIDVTHDGRADLVSYQRTTGTWDVLDTATGSTTSVVVGTPGDMPAAPPSLLLALDPPANDFDANGRTDLTWQYGAATRQALVWYNDNGTLGAPTQRYSYLTSFDVTGWTLAASSDFNGDGIVDLVWQNDAARYAVVWYMGGAGRNQMMSWSWLSAAPVPGWKIVGASDFTGDGQPDLLWQNDATRQASIWIMGGPTGARYDGWAWVSAAEVPGWKIVGVADINDDGQSDVVWQHDASRQVSVWYLGGAQGTTFLGWAYLNPFSVAGWTVVGVRDINSDRIADLVWQNDSDQSASVWIMGGAQGRELLRYEMLTTFSVRGWILSVR